LFTLAYDRNFQIWYGGSLQQQKLKKACSINNGLATGYKNLKKKNLNPASIPEKCLCIILLFLSAKYKNYAVELKSESFG